MNRNRARLGQKMLWHIRWILLVVIIGMNVFIYMQNIALNTVFIVNGIGFAFYFLLSQVEGYFECLSQCRIK